MRRTSTANLVVVILHAFLWLSSTFVSVVGFLTSTTTTTTIKMMRKSSILVLRPSFMDHLQNHHRHSRLNVAQDSFSSSSDNYYEDFTTKTNEMNKIQSRLTRVVMLAYIASMCVALPVTMAPPALLQKLKIIEKKQREHMSLR